MANEKVLPADWLEYIQQTARELKKPPNPPKRRQPKITRMQSSRQSIAESQSPNQVHAIYVPENPRGATPTKPEDWRGTMSPGAEQEGSYRAGKATTEAPFGYSKETPRTHSHGGGRKPTNISALLKEYDV